MCLGAQGGFGLVQCLFSAIVFIILRSFLLTPLSCSHNVVLLVWSEIERTGGWNSAPTCAYSISTAAAYILYHVLSSYCVVRVLHMHLANSLAEGVDTYCLCHTCGPRRIAMACLQGVHIVGNTDLLEERPQSWVCGI